MKRVKDRTWLALLAATIFHGTAMAQMVEHREQTLVGVVITQRKYSLVIAAGGQEWDIKIPDQVPIELQLDRPQFDWRARQVRLEILASAADGDPQRNKVRHFALPDPCWIEVEFAHENERQRAMSGDVKRFVRYKLHGERPASSSPTSLLRFTGRVIGIDDQGIATVETPEGTWVAELGSREAFLTGFSTADLEPFATTVRARVVEHNGEWMAQEIQFRAGVDPLATEKKGLPRLLLLGDEVSLSYFAPLKALLKDEFNVSRPAENCRGSANCVRLDEWLGPYHLPERRWDVICFNVGLADVTLSSQAYQANLELWIAALQRTGAKLVWINTTPVPTGFVSREPGVDTAREIHRLNEAAAEVIRRHPGIATIDLYEWVHDRREKELKSWWRGRAAAFGPNVAGLVAQRIADALPR